MALQLRIVDAKGQSRLVEVQPGTVLEVRPGDQVSFADPAQAGGLRLERSGGALLVIYAEGTVTLNGFYGKPPATLTDVARSEDAPRDPQVLVSVGDNVVTVSPLTDLTSVNQQFPPSGSSQQIDALRTG